MVRINLLPWREKERQRRKRLMTAASIIAVVLILAGALASYFLVEDWILAQEARNALLAAEIARLDSKIREMKEIEQKKQDLLARMEIIQELQHLRPEVVHLFDEIVTTIPNGVLLTGIRQTGNQVVLEGRAQSYGRISELMRNINASAWMTDPMLKIIKEQDKSDTGLSHFELQMRQQRPPSPEEAKAAG
jgi:type IV pilus assembly protein PilN